MPAILRAVAALGYNAAPYCAGQRLDEAKVAELVDAPALGAGGVTRESSNLSFRTSTPKREKD